MRIQHNITALSAANKLKSNESTVSKNIQKLSSGYRINSAADDAAGLAVSEKMRKQINGLSQAEDNTKNGISLIQTAEGGLNETSAILQRMNTLAVESSNGTYKDADRANLQKEVSHLKTEIDRISTSTKFNEISLLDGSLSSTGATAATSVTVSGLALSTVAATAAAVSLAATLATLSVNTPTTYTISYKDANGAVSSTTVTLTFTTQSATSGKISFSNGAPDYAPTVADSTMNSATDDDMENALISALNYDSDFSKNFSVAVDTKKLEFTSKTAGANKESIVGVQVGGAGVVTTPKATGTDGYNTADLSAVKVYDGTDATAKNSVFTVNGQKFAFVESGKSASTLGSDVSAVYVAAGDIDTDGTLAAVGSNTVQKDITDMSSLVNSKTGLATDIKAADNVTIEFKTGTSSKNGNALVFQVGAENTDDQRASLSIANMNSDSLGLTALDISKQGGATAAIDIISKAVATVSSTRADLGALQNELEHTANNLSTMNENLTSAESTIRDVDMTDEYVQYSKNQILSQAANSMLAQANAQPQNVLTLLKG